MFLCLMFFSAILVTFAETPISGIISLLSTFIFMSLILIWNMLEFFAFVILAIYAGAIAIFFFIYYYDIKFI